MKTQGGGVQHWYRLDADWGTGYILLGEASDRISMLARADRAYRDGAKSVRVWSVRWRPGEKEQTRAVQDHLQERAAPSHAEGADGGKAMKKTQRTVAEVKQALAEAANSLLIDQAAVPGGAVVALYANLIRRLLRELTACKE